MSLIKILGLSILGVIFVGILLLWSLGESHNICVHDTFIYNKRFRPPTGTHKAIIRINGHFNCISTVTMHLRTSASEAYSGTEFNFINSVDTVIFSNDWYMDDLVIQMKSDSCVIDHVKLNIDFISLIPSI